MNQLPFLEQLESHNNEPEVRERIAKGEYSGTSLSIAQEWLRRKDAVRSTAAAARAEAREVESLTISRKALSNSRLATRIAIIAILLSIVMAIQKIIEWYSLK